MSEVGLTIEEIKSLMNEYKYSLHNYSGDLSFYTFFAHFDKRFRAIEPNEPQLIDKSKITISCTVWRDGSFQFDCPTSKMFFNLTSGRMSPITNDQHFITNEMSFVFYANLVTNNSPF